MHPIAYSTSALECLIGIWDLTVENWVPDFFLCTLFARLPLNIPLPPHLFYPHAPLPPLSTCSNHCCPFSVYRKSIIPSSHRILCPLQNAPLHYSSCPSHFHLHPLECAIFLVVPTSFLVCSPHWNWSYSFKSLLDVYWKSPIGISTH